MSPSSSSSKAPQLLSNSQKKLNHIHSEQKRRANIRRGYDSLCDVVPALRDAIIAEDKECERTGRKRGRGRLLGDDGEKLDGRAGPRSESVVLQKSASVSITIAISPDQMLIICLPKFFPLIVVLPPTDTRSPIRFQQLSNT